MIDLSLRPLEFDRVVTLFSLEAKSDLGRRSLAARRPARTLEACEREQARLAEMVRYYHTDGQLPFSGLTDVTFLHEIDRVLDLPESWQVLRCIRAIEAVRETFTRNRELYPLLAAICDGMADLSEVSSKAGRYFTRDGKLREDASPELRAIRSRIQGKRGAIHKTLGDLMSRKSESVQEPIITMRGDRYCIPVRTDHRGDVPGILHERSGSGASLFVEPMQVVEMNNELAELFMQEREEIARITRYISQTLIDSADAIVANAEIAGDLDAIQACAILFDRLDCSRPSFTEDHTLTILDGRHPLLDERLADLRREAFGERERGTTIIPMSLHLDEETSALVISGPNAGGKTVTLKTAGLLVAMAASGFPVPAREGTVIPVVDAMHVLIGDDQSLLEDLSTFSAYLVRLRNVLERATRKSLVLLDELGSGTDPEEGSALAAAVIDALLERGSLLIVTTHLSTLKSFAISEKRIANAGMEFDAATGRPTFRMMMGVPGRSRAIEVAERIGLPLPVIENARTRLGDRYGAVDTLIVELQQTLARAADERDALSLARREAEKLRAELAAEREAVTKEKQTLARTYRDEINRMKDEVTSRLNSELRHLREKDKASRAALKVDEGYERVVAPLLQNPKFETANDRPIEAGDKVEHRRFRISGTVKSIDGKKVQLLAGGKSIQADLDDLLLVGGAPKEKKSRTEPLAEGDALDVVPTAELNLIGQRVDDALDECDKFIDRALLEGQRAVRIIHGFGTGALRQAVREHLRRHHGVKTFRGGEKNEGGDGATVAVLS